MGYNKVKNTKLLYFFNWYALLFALPCGMFPIQHYIRTARNPEFSPVPKYILLLFPILLVVLRCMERKIKRIKYCYLLIAVAIVITAFFVLKNTPQYTNGYLWSRLQHAFEYGVINSIGFTFFVYAIKDLMIKDKVLFLIGIIILLNGFFVSALNWKFLLLLSVIGGTYIYDKKKKDFSNL